jgi:hypothetical protein
LWEFFLDLIGCRKRKEHGIDQKLLILFCQIRSEASQKKKLLALVRGAAPQTLAVVERGAWRSSFLAAIVAWPICTTRL